MALPLFARMMNRANSPSPSMLQYFGYGVLSALSGFVTGFAIFGVIWDPNGCNFLIRPIQNQAISLLAGVAVGPLLAFDLYVPKPLGGYSISISLLFILVVGTVSGIVQWRQVLARRVLYLSIALWFAYGSFRWALYC